jgi:ornithine--oxo-acid transaminase
MLPGIKVIPYGDIDALKGAITENTAGFLFEPIQGEAGIVMPPEGFLKEAYDLCKANNVLYIADEIQVGLARTGKMFACDWENVTPDILILGKALGGGVFPISCIVANKDILGVFNPGSHGSTFGGNPLACAVPIASLDVIEEEKLAERSLELGNHMMGELKKINNPIIKEIRGKGMMIGIACHEDVISIITTLREQGLLVLIAGPKVIRLLPPLIVTKTEMDRAVSMITNAIKEKEKSILASS